MHRALGQELLVTRERQPRLRKKKERARRHAETSKDLSRAGDGSQEHPSRGGEHAELAALESLSLDDMPDQLNKHLNKQKDFIHGLVELLKESLDDMPAELNEQGDLTAGLVMLLKKSIASEKKATDEILLKGHVAPKCGFGN